MSEREMGIDVVARVQDAIDSMQTLVSSILDIPDNKDVEIDVLGDASEQVSQIQSQIEMLDGESVGVTIDAEDNSQDIVDAVQSKISELNGETANVNITADGDEAIAVAEDVKTKMEELNGDVVTITINADDEVSDELDNTTQSSENTGNAIGDVVSAATMLKFGMDGLDFQKYVGMADAYTNATDSQKNAIEGTIRSNSSAKYKINDLAEGYAWLAKQTGSATDSQKLFKTELSYIKANDADLQGGMTQLTNLYKMYGLNADQAKGATSTLNGEILKTGYSGDQFLSLISKSSMDLKNMGFSLQDTGAIVSSFGRSGISAEQTMRAMRSGFSQFSQQFTDANPAISDYEKKIQAAGVATRDANGNLRSQKDVMSDLLESFSKMPDGPQKTQLAMEIFGTSAGKILGNLKVDYKDVETDANNAGQAQVEAAAKAKKENQDLLGLLDNAQQWISSYLGTLGAYTAEVGSLVFGGLALKKFGLGGLDKIFDKLPDSWKEGWNSAKEKIKKTIGLDDVENTVKSKFNDLKGKIKDNLKNLLGDEEGSIRAPDLSKFKSIGQDMFDAMIAPFKQASNIVKWQDLLFDAEKSLRGYTQVNIGELIPGWEDGKIVKPDPKPWSVKFNQGLDELKAEIKADHPEGILSEIFGDEKGTVNTSFIDDAITNIKGKLPSFEDVGSKIPESILNGIKSKLPSLSTDSSLEGLGAKLVDGIPKGVEAAIPRIVPRIVSDVLGIGPLVLSALSGAGENWHKSLGEQTKESLGLDFLGGIVDSLGLTWAAGVVTTPFKNVAKFLGLDQITKITPEKFWSYFFGTDTSKKFGDWLDKNISGPINHWFLSLPGKIQSYLGNIHLPNINLGSVKVNVPKINWSNITQGASGPINTVKGWYGDLKTYIDKHKPSIPKLPWPNVSSGVSSAVKTAESWYGSLKTYVSSHTPKIPKLPWPNLSSGLKSIVDTIGAEIDRLLANVKKLPGAGALLGGSSSGSSTSTNGSKSWGSSLMNAIGSGISAGLPYIDKGLRAVTSRFPQSPPKTGPLSEITGAKMESWMGTVLSGGLNALSRLPHDMDSVMAAVPTNMFSWGSSIVDSFIQGFDSQMPSLDSLLDRFSSMFPHSPPRTGPLSTIKTENMKKWASSIMGAGVEGLSPLTDVFNGLNPNFSGIPDIRYPSIPRSENGSNDTKIIFMDGAIRVDGTGSKDDLKEAGKTVGNTAVETMAQRLSRQANTSGVSVVNAMR